MDYIKPFSEWLDGILQIELPLTAKAICFNLYENENFFQIQLIASSYFEENDSEWPCHEVYTTGEDLFEIERSEDMDDWIIGLELSANLVYQYLASGMKRNKLQSFEAVAIGFVDGDLITLYSNNDIKEAAIKDYLATIK